MSTYVPFLDRFKLAGVEERLPDGGVRLANAEMGRVEIDGSKCSGCRLCVKVCPATALEMDGLKNVKMTSVNAGCIACSDCVAICRTDAITLTRPMTIDGLYRHLGRGPLTPPRRF
jgi:ferredoxin